MGRIAHTVEGLPRDCTPPAWPAEIKEDTKRSGAAEGRPRCAVCPVQPVVYYTKSTIPIQWNYDTSTIMYRYTIVEVSLKYR